MFNDKRTKKIPIHKFNNCLFEDVTKKELVKGSIRKFFFGAKVELEKDSVYKNNKEAIGELFINAFGGKLLALKESNKDGDKTADFLWNNKTMVEVKESNGSNSSLNYAFRKGRKQIDENGVIIVYIRNTEVIVNNVLRNIITKMITYRVNNVVVIIDKKSLIYCKKSNRCLFHSVRLLLLLAISVTFKKIKVKYCYVYICVQYFKFYS
jgi:hypothetical protein